MSINLKPLADTSRLLLTVPVQPVQGRRFQPTGFPDLGAATYQAPSDGDGAVSCLLVESAQSMANRLELTIWDVGESQLKTFAKGLSYVKVVNEKKQHLTSSIEEAHRLNSVYIEKANDGKFHDQLAAEIGYDEKEPVDRANFLATVFKYDVNSLVHGVFLESVGGRLRVARALSAFIESEEVEVAASGGVKNDHVRPGTEKGGEMTAAEGYGNVPFSREEYTAAKTCVYVNLDVAQIRGYGLGEAAERLLVLLGLYKIRTFLDRDMRLRTACDFKLVSDKITADKPKDYELPSRTDLEAALPDAIKACMKSFAGEDGITTVTYKMK